MSEITVNAADDEQRREHTGVRTLGEHFSAREVYHALHCPYPGTDVLRAKERRQARASTERARGGGSTYRGACAAASQDRRGEQGASI